MTLMISLEEDVRRLHCRTQSDVMHIVTIVNWGREALKSATE